MHSNPHPLLQVDVEAVIARLEEMLEASDRGSVKSDRVRNALHDLRSGARFSRTSRTL